MPGAFEQKGISTWLKCGVFSRTILILIIYYSLLFFIYLTPPIGLKK